MVTLHAMRNVDGDKLYAYDFCGLSTDEKPQTYGGKELEANSMFLELDTGDFYFLETPAQSGKEDLIPQTSFVGESDENYYYYVVRGTVFSNEIITVEFDGVKYECDRNDYEEDGGNYTYRYGAPIDPYTDIPDFSDYPFVVDVVNGLNGTAILVQDDNEHTIEVYVDSSTPAVWKKVGSGGSTPQTELPKITVSMTPDKSTLVVNNVCCAYDENENITYYDKDGNVINPSEWTDIVSFSANETKTVTAYSREFEYYGEIVTGTLVNYCILDFNSATHSDEVNCRYDDGLIEILDPTQDASISLSVHIEALG